MTERLKGAVAPVMTPFRRDLEPDTRRFVAHCRWLVANNAGLAIFGTNSEAASMSVDERLRLTDALLEAGVPASKMMPGTGASSISDAVTLSRHAVKSGAAGVLMLPPFYYKGVTDPGLFDYYAHVIDKVASDALRIYLYHIPQVTQVPITLKLIEMLRAKFPKTVAGAKDSSGNWDNTKAMLDNFAKDGFDVFPASESTLTAALPLGAAGCISATVNLNPANIRAVFDKWNSPEGPALQARVDVIRKIFQSPNMIPAMKRVAAEFSGQRDWAVVRPPLVALDDENATRIMGELRAAGFEMPGFAEAMRA
ncbi:MAG TPA: dihydrodipicolinate synthase family protein [Ramlibacter sp.]|nr:dihydrodipicolinate synthase family protein [Ramlibacter sp.]